MVELRVWWIPQIPLKSEEESFYVKVSSLVEAKKVLDTLADYDKYQFEHNIKPDYSNAGGLQYFWKGEWIDWEDKGGYGINDLSYEQLNEQLKEQEENLNGN